MKFKYRIYGLVVQSEVELPECLLCNDQDEVIDVKITIGDIPKKLDQDRVIVRGNSQIAPNHYLLHHHNAPSYYVSRGNSIIISPNYSSVHNIHAYLYSSVFAALLYQRGYFLLHASVVEKNGLAYAFVGKSGRGKSTLAALLLDHGFQLVSDDICAVRFIDDHPLVEMAYPRIKLWGDTITNLGWEKDAGELIKKRVDVIEKDKYWISHHKTHNSKFEATILNGIYFLSFNGEQEKITIDELSGSSVIRYLLKGSFRMGIAEGLGIQNQHFKQCLKLSTSLNIYRLGRASDSRDLLSFVSKVAQHILSLSEK